MLVGVSEIADLAGVKGAAVVTNWRARSSRFPEPKVGGTQPRFDLDEVMQWLRHDAPRGRVAPEVDPDWLWPRLVDAFAREAGVADVRPALAALIAVRHLVADGDDWRGFVSSGDPAALRRAARAAERAAHGLRDELVRRLAVSGTADYTAHLAVVLDASVSGSERHLAAVLDLEASTGRRPSVRTRAALTGSMIGLAEVRPRDRVFDPACGVGDLLVECTQRGVGSVCGQDVDADATFLATVRLTLLGADVRLAPAGHDSIVDDQFATQRFDLVLVDPPVGDAAPPLGRWLEHALDHLAPEGRLVISMPLHELVPVRAARRRPDRRLVDLLGKVAVSTPLRAAAVVARGGRADVTGPVVVLCLGGVAQRDGARAVPVVTLLERPRDLSVAVVAEAMADAVAGRGGAGGVEVVVETADAAEVFAVLRAAGELVEQRTTARRHPNAPPDFDSSWNIDRASVGSDDASFAPPSGTWAASAVRADAAFSDAARLAASLDPLMVSRMQSRRRDSMSSLRLGAPTPSGIAQGAPDRSQASSALGAATDRLLSVLRGHQADLERAAPGLYEELLAAAVRIRLAAGEPSDDVPRR